MLASKNMDSMEEDGKPQPMAGFRVGTVTPTTRNVRKLQSDRRSKKSVERDQEVKLRVVSPPPLTPMAGVEVDNNNIKFGAEKENERQFVYFPVDVEVENLVDWKVAAKEKGSNNNNWSNNNNNNNNNNNVDLSNQKKSALVKVNNTEVAVFKYGDEILATTNKCPHAGGPLHLGDIEVLPDKSLCVRCPWHKWAFCVAKPQSGEPMEKENFRRNLFSEERPSARIAVGDCVFPPGRDDKKMSVYPAVFDKKRKQVKIGFESFNSFTLMNETF